MNIYDIQQALTRTFPGMQVTAVTNRVLHINDGNCRWFANYKDITVPGDLSKDPQTRSIQYSEWCQSHRALRVGDLTKYTQGVVRNLRLTDGGW